MCEREILRDRVLCATLLFGHVLNLLHRDISIMELTVASDLRGHVNMVVSKKMSLPAPDLHYIITSKILVHCMEHQYAFFLQNTCCD